MTEENVFISGLPRSGSTVLCNLLTQNPKLKKITVNREIGTDNSIGDLMQLKTPKIIVTYRPILEILASFIRQADTFPTTNFIDKKMIEENFPPLFYRPINDARCDWLMRPYGGIDLTNTVFKNMAIHKEWFHCITYEELVINPQESISKLYNFLEFEPYEHDFDNIPQHDNSSDGDIFGIPTLHTIRPSISKSLTKPEEILSNYVMQKYSNAMDFFTKGWLQSQT